MKYTIEDVINSVQQKDRSVFFVSKKIYNIIIRLNGQTYITQEGGIEVIESIDRYIILKKHLKNIKYVCKRAPQ